jgi:hypothetical protein
VGVVVMSCPTIITKAFWGARGVARVAISDISGN